MVNSHSVPFFLHPKINKPSTHRFDLIVFSPSSRHVSYSHMTMFTLFLSLPPFILFFLPSDSFDIKLVLMLSRSRGGSLFVDWKWGERWERGNGIECAKKSECFPKFVLLSTFPPSEIRVCLFCVRVPNHLSLILFCPYVISFSSPFLPSLSSFVLPIRILLLYPAIEQAFILLPWTVS